MAHIFNEDDKRYKEKRMQVYHKTRSLELLVEQLDNANAGFANANAGFANAGFANANAGFVNHVYHGPVSNNPNGQIGNMVNGNNSGKVGSSLAVGNSPNNHKSREARVLSMIGMEMRRTVSPELRVWLERLGWDPHSLDLKGLIQLLREKLDAPSASAFLDALDGIRHIGNAAVHEECDQAYLCEECIADVVRLSVVAMSKLTSELEDEKAKVGCLEASGSGDQAERMWQANVRLRSDIRRLRGDLNTLRGELNALKARVSRFFHRRGGGGRGGRGGGRGR